jgi:ribosomal protein L24E
MRDASPLPPNSDGLQRTGLHCQCCGRIIVRSVEGLYSIPARGSSQRFCSAACRQAAYRRRQAQALENTPLQKHGGRGRHLSP